MMLLGLRELIRWWADQMAALLPARLHRDAATDVLVVAADPVGLTLLRRRNGRERMLGHVPAGAPEDELLRLIPRRRGPLLLRVAAGLLQRDVALPIAAERQLGRVLQYELDRLTPFRAEEVVWDWARLRREPAQGRIHVRIWLVPRAGLLPVLDILARARLIPDLLEATAPGGTTRLIRLRRPAPGRRAALRWGAIVCAVLAGLAVAVPFIRQSLAAAAIESRIADLRPYVAEVARLRRQRGEGGDVVAAEQARLGDAVAALVAVTRALPDDTYLTEFALRQRKLRLAGESRGAAALIPLLAAVRQFRNPAFAAPVTRSDTAGADLFAIQVDLAP